MKQRYFGSVRFFKNLILLAVIVAIAVPTGLAVHYSSVLSRLEANGAHPQDSASASAGSLPESGSEVKDEAPAPEAQPDGSEESAALQTEEPAYTQLYPDFYAPQPLAANQSTDQTAFLTFDDGPSDRTDQILQILKEKDVNATFFVIGKTDETSLQRMRNIVAGGNTIGMHSYSHEYRKIYASVDAYLEDMYQIFTLIRDTTGVTPSVFRMPGGSINSYDYGVYREILSEMLRRGFVPCDWNLSSGDATGGSITKAQMLSNTVTAAQNVNRGFILMHDAADKTTTVAALPEMIDGLKAQNFTFAVLTPETKPVLFGYTD